MVVHHPGVRTVSIGSVTGAVATPEVDEVSVEEPLEIRIRASDASREHERPIAVTMRTPGADLELAAGFLFTEAIVRQRGELVDLQAASANEVLATISPALLVDTARLERQSFVSSSCGVCGKRSIASVFTVRQYSPRPGQPAIRPEIVHDLAGTLRSAQDAFNRTGGIHASALFTSSGQLLSEFEDVGRHNALDKLIGAEFLAARLPLEDKILLVSGRASFELIQKAAMAGIPVVAAVGAPSSLAVTLARESGMTLLGFVRDGRFNVYCDAGRLAGLPEPPH